MVLILGIEVDTAMLFTALQAVILAVAAFVVARLIRRLFDRYAGKTNERSGKMLGWILQSIVYLVAVLAIGATLNVDVSSVIIGLGAGSIAVSFALSTLINNLVAGFLIQADGSVRIGDNVSVGGIDGRVVRMRTRAMMLVTKEGHLVFVPNSYFMTNPVINRGRETAP